MQIKGKKIILRPLTLDDYPIWKEAHSKIIENKNLWDSSHRPKDKLTKKYYKLWLKTHNTETRFCLGIFSTAGNYVGFIQFMDIIRGVYQNAFVGYSLLNTYWQKGYGKEALNLFINFGFKTMKLHRIEAGIEPKNKASIALAKSAGMKKIVTNKKHLYLRGEWQDLCAFVILSEDRGIKCKPI